MKEMKDKLIGASGSITGAASIMGSWQVCHNLCLGLIAILGAIGITLTGMPLLFLTKIAVPLWSIAAGLLLITGYLYIKKRCVSGNLLIINTGLIIAGTPFQSIRPYQVAFWVAGGVSAATGILLYIMDRTRKKRCHHENH